MNKEDRQALIESIVRTQIVQKQEDFVNALKEEGLEVTQATISRDIQELQLIKMPMEEGGYRYGLPMDPESDTRRQIEKILKESFVSIDSMDNMVYIQTIPGSGDALGATISGGHFDEIFAVITNDASNLIICRSVEDAENLRNTVLQFM